MGNITVYKWKIYNVEIKNLFTSVLNARLNKFIEKNILEENQAGLRNGYSTTDHVFVLHSLIEIIAIKIILLFYRLKSSI